MTGGHGHSHNHGGGGGCDHGQAGKEGEEIGLSYSLYQKIDMNNLTCLNEEIEDSGKTIFKAWEDRKDREKFVLSDADEELLINIPFTGEMRLMVAYCNSFDFQAWSQSMSVSPSPFSIF